MLHQIRPRYCNSSKITIFQSRLLQQQQCRRLGQQLQTCRLSVVPTQGQPPLLGRRESCHTRCFGSQYSTQFRCSYHAFMRRPSLDFLRTTTCSFSSSSSCDKEDKKESLSSKDILVSPGIAGAYVSADAATADIADAAATAATIAAKARQPVLFPWRHETVENMIPRFTPGTLEFANDRIRARQLGQDLLSWVFLGMPWFRKKAWHTDLANSCAWSFTQAVGGILSNVYSINPQQILGADDDEGKIDFTFPLNENNFNNFNDTDVNNENTSGKLDNNNLETMMSRPLRNLYQAAHQYGHDHLSIRLQTEPVKAVLHSVFCFPFLTREAAENDPLLLKQILLLDGMDRFKLVRNHIESEYVLHNELRTTIEIQVAISCNERFQVIDRNTGVVVQGSNDGLIREGIIHVVRFEMTVVSSPDEHARLGNWQITDIDDLLGPTTWYNVV